MNVHYTGRHVEQLSDAQKRKLEPKFRKIEKILGNRYVPETHVIASLQRHLYVAEVTLNYRHNTMVVECSGTDLFSTVQEAVEKLERQIIRNKDRWRERKRRSKSAREKSGSAPEEASNDGAAGPRVIRGVAPAPKPLTIEEAILEMEQDNRDCVVYHDAKGRRSVLFRRRDGNLQLVEG